MNFVKPKRSGLNRVAMDKVSTWIQSKLRVDQPTVLDASQNLQIMVTEVECNAPDCVPIETLIVLIGNSIKWTGKVLKPIKDVSESDVVELEIPKFGDASQRSIANVEEISDIIFGDLQKKLMSIDDEVLRAGVAKRLEQSLAEFVGLSETDKSVSQVLPIASAASATESIQVQEESKVIRVAMKPKKVPSTVVVSVAPVSPQINVDGIVSSKPRHEKGVRPRGCPCCDPSNIDNIVDMLFVKAPP